MRPLLQYDLDEPPVAPVSGSQPNTGMTGRGRGSWLARPPSKKRKRNRNPQNLSSMPQHWDDPGSAADGVVYDEESVTPIPGGSVVVSYTNDFEEVDVYGEVTADGNEGADMEREEKEEGGGESRPLTHEEIWDDAALIDAWNSAEAEYEAYHGTSKAWKTEPVKKSPLWYNKPYTAPASEPGPSGPKPRSMHVTSQEQPDGEPDTAPLDYNTYIPTHDPTLGITSNTKAGATPGPFFVPPPSSMAVSRDEAFSNALSAMYWGGYWTAVYHCQSQTNGENNSGPTEATEEERIGTDEDEDLVPAQR